MAWLSGSQWWDLVKSTIRGWVDDAAPSMGASLAFYTLFSLTPLLLVVIALAGLFVGRDIAQNTLVAQLAQFLGEKAAYGIEALLDAAGTRDEGIFAAVTGGVTLVIGATTLFAELQSDMNRIWRDRPSKTGGLAKFLRTRGVSFLLVVGVGALLLASMLATTVLTMVGKAWFPEAHLAVRSGEFAISFLVITGLFAMIYKLLPAAPIAWSDVWIGAAVTSVLFWVGKLAIGLYIAHAALGSKFGAAGAIVVLVAWVYYSAQIFFLGAEFTRQYALRHGSLKDEPIERRRRPREPANDAELVHRARRIVKGEDPALEHKRDEGRGTREARRTSAT